MSNSEEPLYDDEGMNTGGFAIPQSQPVEIEIESEGETRASVKKFVRDRRSDRLPKIAAATLATGAALMAIVSIFGGPEKPRREKDSDRIEFASPERQPRRLIETAFEAQSPSPAPVIAPAPAPAPVQREIRKSIHVAVTKLKNFNVNFDFDGCNCKDEIVPGGERSLVFTDEKTGARYECEPDFHGKVYHMLPHARVESDCDLID